MASIKQEMENLRNSITTIETNTTPTLSQTIYDVWDISRNKRVAFLSSNYHIKVGERIFLNDDIWDVKLVKVFTSGLPPTTDGTQHFNSSMVQLLVTFGGKATDMQGK